MALFDRYIAVDWSANSTPKRGPDSIWSCVVAAETSDLQTVNHATRRQAESWLTQRLVDAVDAGERVLVGLDFPYGYPAGFAQALDVDGWSGIWRYLDERISDDASNRNNRFAVAAEINARLGTWAPFWGRPTDLDLPTLPARKVVSYADSNAVTGLPEWRSIEQRLRTLGTTPQSAWKLAYTGSVGGQTLVGIPVLRHLRFHDKLRDVSRVWPFEGRPELPTGTAAIVHAEIWPSIVRFDHEPGICRDEKQARATANHFQRLDRSVQLARLFDLEEIGGWRGMRKAGSSVYRRARKTGCRSARPSRPGHPHGCPLIARGMGPTWISLPDRRACAAAVGIRAGGARDSCPATISGSIRLRGGASTANARRRADSAGLFHHSS